MNSNPTQLETDRSRIELLGGAAAVSRLLGYDRSGGTQRVFNWMTRGIPPSVKIQRPDLFLVDIEELRKTVAASSTT